MHSVKNTINVVCGDALTPAFSVVKKRVVQFQDARPNE